MPIRWAGVMNIKHYIVERLFTAAAGHAMARGQAESDASAELDVTSQNPAEQVCWREPRQTQRKKMRATCIRTRTLPLVPLLIPVGGSPPHHVYIPFWKKIAADYDILHRRQTW